MTKDFELNTLVSGYHSVGEAAFKIDGELEVLKNTLLDYVTKQISEMLYDRGIYAYYPSNVYVHVDGDSVTINTDNYMDTYNSQFAITFNLMDDGYGDINTIGTTLTMNKTMAVGNDLQPSIESLLAEWVFSPVYFGINMRNVTNTRYDVEGMIRPLVDKFRELVAMQEVSNTILPMLFDVAHSIGFEKYGHLGTLEVTEFSSYRYKYMRFDETSLSCSTYTDNDRNLVGGDTINVGLGYISRMEFNDIMRLTALDASFVGNTQLKYKMGNFLLEE